MQSQPAGKPDFVRSSGWMYLALWMLIALVFPLLAVSREKELRLNDPAIENRVVGIRFGENGTRIPIVEPVAHEGHSSRWPFVLLYTLPLVLSPLLFIALRRLIRPADAWLLQHRTERVCSLALLITDSSSSMLDPLLSRLKMPAVGVRVLQTIGALPGHDRPQTDAHGAIVEASAFRLAVSQVVKGVIVILALMILERLSSALLRGGGHVCGMSLKEWVGVVIPVVIASLAIRLFQPVKSMALFYLSKWVNADNTSDRERYIGEMVAATSNLLLLGFIAITYWLILPVIEDLNDAFLNFAALTTILNVLVILVVCLILYALWKNIQPVIDHLTGQITDKVTTLSGGITLADCPACQARNDQDATFCIACGASMAPDQPILPGNPPTANPVTDEPVPNTETTETPSNTRTIDPTLTDDTLESIAPSVHTGHCPHCATDNPPAAKFCCQCGTPMQ